MSIKKLRPGAGWCCRSDSSGRLHVHGAAHAGAHVELSQAGSCSCLSLSCGPLVGLGLTWPARRIRLDYRDRDVGFIRIRIGEPLPACGGTTFRMSTSVANAAESAMILAARTAWLRPRLRTRGKGGACREHLYCGWIRNNWDSTGTRTDRRRASGHRDDSLDEQTR